MNFVIWRLHSVTDVYIKMMFIYLLKRSFLMKNSSLILRWIDVGSNAQLKNVLIQIFTFRYPSLLDRKGKYCPFREYTTWNLSSGRGGCRWCSRCFSIPTSEFGKLPSKAYSFGNKYIRNSNDLWDRRLSAKMTAQRDFEDHEKDPRHLFASLIHQSEKVNNNDTERSNRPDPWKTFHHPSTPAK